ncbi:M20 metallopeptidase family protein [Terribacillus halophilus]|jgi:amidohydrolase|uniref:M20 metallopeptidase family protein n=1 Tax=Terribacillus halophilus TaxID=361279 RepID=UPI000984AC55|nr:amidohydrolase [Terribacillus halophilus]
MIVDKLVDQAIQDRRHFHQYPELSGKEYETGKYVQSRLEKLGIEILDFQPPSVVGYVKGTKGDKTIALRADMDALPIVEEGDKPYISKHHGVSHMCGHDGHTAILLAVAEWTSLHREKIEPNIVFLFQSSEEASPSGADKLIKEGVLEGVDSIYGIHVDADLEKGQFGTRPGAMMASVDDFEIKIQGSGGHASTPHLTVDPIYIATHVIQSLQSIISRKLNPMDASVISVGKIEAGNTYNVIPDSAKIIGTMRSFSTEAVQTIQEQITKLTTGICESFGATAEVEFIVGTPPLVNDEQEAAFAEKVLQDTFGAERYEELEPVMGSEDFSYYLQKIPGVFIKVGMQGEKSQYPHHHPKFDIDEDVFGDAIEVFLKLIQHS